MPEGHTIHHLIRKLGRALQGRNVRASSPQGRFFEGANELDGKRVISVEARGKHALVHWPDTALHVHLGLYGRTRWHQQPAPPPKGAVRLRLETDNRCFDLVGPNRCVLLDSEDVAALHRRLGQDPLRSDADPDAVVAAFSRTRRAVAGVLLDQSVIAGLGNVYRAELLFLAGINPYRPAKDISEAAVRRLWSLSEAALRVGLKHNQIRVFGESALPSPAGAEGLVPSEFTIQGRWGPRPDRLWVYKRPNCKVCGSPITQEMQANRTLYWCPACQRD